MPRKTFTAEKIIRMLREAEVELAQGQTVVAECRELGVTANMRHKTAAVMMRYAHSTSERRRAAVGKVLA